MSIKINEVQNTTYEVDGKVYKTVEEAEAAQAKLANVAVGLEFAEAQYPDLAPRAKRTKANLVGEYLDWVDAGKPEAESATEEA